VFFSRFEAALNITPDTIETVLADLRGLGLDELCGRQSQDALEPYRTALINQVERPRINLGTGPPGRAD
jgi:hypothetical protein